MVPMLPCTDIEEMQRFWTALGLHTTYRQLRPNPYLAMERNALVLHYYALPGLEPSENHSTCLIVVTDTSPIHQLFTDGLRSLYGKVPLSGTPRLTRARKRANNAGLSGFSLIDPAGNWIRVSRRPRQEQQPKAVDDRTEWVSSGGGALARAVENAIVIADSHGDVRQAQRILAGALARQVDSSVADLAAAWAYLAELHVRGKDFDGAQAAAAEVRRIAALPELTPKEKGPVMTALDEVNELDLPTGR